MNTDIKKISRRIWLKDVLKYYPNGKQLVDRLIKDDIYLLHLLLGLVSDWEHMAMMMRYTKFYY